MATCIHLQLYKHRTGQRRLQRFTAVLKCSLPSPRHSSLRPLSHFRCRLLVESRNFSLNGLSPTCYASVLRPLDLPRRMASDHVRPKKMTFVAFLLCAPCVASRHVSQSLQRPFLNAGLLIDRAEKQFGWSASQGWPLHLCLEFVNRRIGEFCHPDELQKPPCIRSSQRVVTKERRLCP